jgi:hypothetical protein
MINQEWQDLIIHFLHHSYDKRHKNIHPLHYAHSKDKSEFISSQFILPVNRAFFHIGFFYSQATTGIREQIVYLNFWKIH